MRFFLLNEVLQRLKVLMKSVLLTTDVHEKTDHVNFQLNLSHREVELMAK